MTSWQTAMVYVLPLLALSGVGTATLCKWWRHVEPKARAWAVMLVASLATYAVAPVKGDVPFQLYAAVDLLAAFAVLSRPRLFANWAIGLLFSVMVAVDVLAYKFGSDGTGLYHSSQLYLGWLQWFVLVIWGTHDAARGVVLYFRHRRTGSDRQEAARASRPGAET